MTGVKGRRNCWFNIFIVDRLRRKLEKITEFVYFLLFFFVVWFVGVEEVDICVFQIEKRIRA